MEIKKKGRQVWPLFAYIPALRTTTFYCCAFIFAPSWAGLMRYDIAVQEHRDFAKNQEKYAAGTCDIPVYKKEGLLSGYIDRTESVKVAQGAALHVDKYVRMMAKFLADKGAHLSLGINNGTLPEGKIWQCHAVIYLDAVSCGQPQEDALILAR